MSEYGLWGYLAKAHHAHLMREAALARGAQTSGQARRLPSALQKLLMLALPLN
ncbi:MAG: hypothetical protein JXA93_13860 [Anaerolineae bacterium]|nr:hypothetical protein [Anaerolineae bacterium]